jgi:predicted site-specific integrase-resolvase
MAERDARRLLRDREVAEYYQVSQRTVRLWRAKGAIETARTPGGRPRTPWRAADPDDDGNERQ